MNKYQITVRNYETLEVLQFSRYADNGGDRCLLESAVREARELGWDLSNVEINVRRVA